MDLEIFPHSFDTNKVLARFYLTNTRLCRTNNLKLYVVWSGNYRTDLFIVDSLELLANVFNIERD